MNPYPDNPENQPQPDPLREDWNYTQRTDSKGQPYDDLEQHRSVFISPEGAVVQKVWRKERHYHCGHGSEQPMGGRCSEPDCFNVSCQTCFTRCSKCQVALCLYHVRSIENANAQKSPICSHCREELKRNLFWRRFWSVIFSPFVDLDKPTR
jgi:hypothetical protein